VRRSRILLQQQTFLPVFSVSAFSSSQNPAVGLECFCDKGKKQTGIAGRNIRCTFAVETKKRSADEIKKTRVQTRMARHIGKSVIAESCVYGISTVSQPTGSKATTFTSLAWTLLVIYLVGQVVENLVAQIVKSFVRAFFIHVCRTG
jgi:hypothetical protein